MNKEINNNPRSSRLPQLKVLKPSTKINQRKKEPSRAIIKTSDKSSNISQKPTPGTPEEGKHLRKTLQTTVSNTTLVENSAVGKGKFKVVNKEKASKNIGRAAVATASTNITYIVPTKENNYNKENKENDAVGRLLPYVGQTEMSLFTPVIETTTSHNKIGLSIDAKKMSLESISTSPSTSTAVTKVEGEINVSRLDCVGNKDVVMSNVGDPLRSQKVLGPLSPTRKRKIEEDKDQNIRNVRTKKVPELSDFNAQEQKLQELRAESIQFQGNIEEAYIVKSALFADNIFLENEKNCLQHERMEVFAQVCQLEHELACENAEIVKLLDEIVERKNDMRFLKQENDDLLRERVNYEKKAAAAKNQLEELIKFSAKIENEFREVVHQLEQKIGVNDALKAAVDEIKTQMDSHLNASEPDLVSSSRWRCNIL